MENSFKGITLSLTFDMAGDTCRRCTRLFMVIIGYEWETMLCLFGQNCRSTYIDDGVLYLKLL